MERYRQSCFVCVLRQVPIFDEAVEELMDAVHGAGGGGGGGGERPPRRLSRRPPTRYETRVCAPRRGTRRRRSCVSCSGGS